jgi:hypothetical protein
LNEPPAAPLTADQIRAQQQGNTKVLNYVGWFLLIAGMISAGTNPPKEPGSVEAIIDLAFVIVGAGLLILSYRLGHRMTASQHDDTRSSPP